VLFVGQTSGSGACLLTVCVRRTARRYAWRRQVTRPGNASCFCGTNLRVTRRRAVLRKILNKVLKKSFSEEKTCKNPNVFEGRFSKTALFQQPVKPCRFVNQRYSRGYPAIRDAPQWFRRPSIASYESSVLSDVFRRAAENCTRAACATHRNSIL